MNGTINRGVNGDGITASTLTDGVESEIDAA